MCVFFSVTSTESMPLIVMAGCDVTVWDLDTAKFTSSTSNSAALPKPSSEIRHNCQTVIFFFCSPSCRFNLTLTLLKGTMVDNSTRPMDAKRQRLSAFYCKHNSPNTLPALVGLTSHHRLGTWNTLWISILARYFYICSYLYIVVLIFCFFEGDLIAKLSDRSK